MIDRISNQLDSTSGTIHRESRDGPSPERQLRAAAKQAISQAGAFIAAHPAAALGAAVLVGVTIGWWVKRK